ncbi:PAS domain-containing protein [Herbaspirillum huttiense F1]|jgi:predicted transcriptional regulator YheO|uniref:PAS domain-containing protein n=3 Tax=Pseudomonadota TaxID=1224 RepID=A0AAJ2LRP0_9BURK|nr:MULTISPECIES: PAS domain-containing protein [Herbaspirillum]MBN9354843.1 PAS domain-containing protein [Herbaspirillum huttiense]MDR9836344.1 PAS domain-containing protein [Herbaspirillum huttiense]MDT0358698.1 PAS domain-containing protein [Herbaspirillum huttiense F1]UWE16851.1 PAS domain-containing protein [Herbaspirillum huttiense]
MYCMSSRTRKKKPDRPDHALLLSQLQQVAQGLGETFAPFCEVVLHDLRDADHSIVALHNNLSGREVGDATTELGLARIADESYPQVLTNYANTLPDGRQAKSTSIGIKDADGKYVAALCMNIDLTLFGALQGMLRQFGGIDQGVRVAETLEPAGAEGLRSRIDAFAARLSTTPRSLKAEDRRQLMRELRQSGCLDIRRAAEIVAAHLGVSRATVYNDEKE